MHPQANTLSPPAIMIFLFIFSSFPLELFLSFSLFNLFFPPLFVFEVFSGENSMSPIRQGLQHQKAFDLLNLADDLCLQKACFFFKATYFFSS